MRPQHINLAAGIGILNVLAALLMAAAILAIFFLAPRKRRWERFSEFSTCMSPWLGPA